MLYLFDVLTKNRATYDVYLHTWKSNDNYVWGENYTVPNDYTEHELLNPNGGYKIDEQDDFLRSENFFHYFNPYQPEWRPELIKNLLCATESQKRCFQMVIESNKHYDHVIFARPDAMFKYELPYDDIFNKINWTPNTIVVPDNNWFRGYNDQFAITNFNNARYYAFRKDEMVAYRKNKKCIISEEYLKYIIDKYYNVQSVKFEFELIRPF
jgi:hypothetical protein